MGKAKYIYFQDDIADNLEKVENMSALINDLLRKHFDKKDINKMSVKELDELIKKEKAKKEYETKLKEIDNDGHRRNKKS